MTYDPVTPEESLAETRWAECSLCEKGGVLVDTEDGEIIEAGHVTGLIDPERYLLLLREKVDGVERVVCRNCQGEDNGKQPPISRDVPKGSA